MPAKFILCCYLILSCLLLTFQVKADCSYSAYVDFGEAVTGGDLNKKELVFRSSGIKRNIRNNDSSKNLKAVYTSYDQVKVGSFEIINIGPFDTEALVYNELKELIEDLRKKGYIEKTPSHSMPALIIRNKNPC